MKRTISADRDFGIYLFLSCQLYSLEESKLFIFTVFYEKSV